MGESSAPILSANLLKMRYAQMSTSNYPKLIQLERDRLWHKRPKGESKTFKRLKLRLNRYMVRAVEGKKKNI